MKRIGMIGACVVVAALGLARAADEQAAGGAMGPPEKSDKHIDLVICLDTSGSMEGLIESAKQKLWAVVNELATAKPRPALRVALYHYGNTGLNRQTGWVQQLAPLTEDLDSIYSKLFPLTTSGGTEYVARVVRAAVHELDWNTDKGTLRVMFVAGNEPATQDKEYALQDICKEAASKGIIVNTIFCGALDTGRQTGWEDAAKWADGQYSAIDQDRGTVVVSTPYDQKIAELGVELNKTYVSYGAAGQVGAAMQKAMDDKAAKLSAPVAAERAAAKATDLYRNARWDLVDATKEGKVEMEKLADADLPEEMQKMTPEQRKAHVETMARRRAEIQKEIQHLNAKREQHVRAEMAEQGLSEDKALDGALRKAVREQAEAKDFEFKKN